MQKRICLFLMFIYFGLLAQEKVNNNDLRGEIVVAKITHIDNSKYEIKKTKLEELSLNIYKNKKYLKRKISKSDFESFDSEYVSMFIHMKYMTTSDETKKCKKFSSLHMRGEDLKVCKDNIKNIKIVENLIQKLDEKI